MKLLYGKVEAHRVGDPVGVACSHRQLTRVAPMSTGLKTLSYGDEVVKVHQLSAASLIV